MEENSNKTFASILKQLLKERKISQIELSNYLDVQPATVSRYISGTNEPNHKITVKIANYLNVSCDFLLGYTPLEESLSKEEKSLIKTYRALPENGKIVAKKHIELLKKNL